MAVENKAEEALRKIKNYQNEPDAFNQEGVKEDWKKYNWLPYPFYKRFVKKVIDDYFAS